MIWHKDLIRFLPDDILKELCKTCLKILKSITGSLSIVSSDEICDWMITYILLVLCEAYNRNLDYVDPCLNEIYNLLPEINGLVAYHDLCSEVMTESKLRADLYSLEDTYLDGKIEEKDWIPIVSAFPEFNLMLKEGGI